MFSPLIDIDHFHSLIDQEGNFFIYKYNPNNCGLSRKTRPIVEAFLTTSGIQGYIIDVIEQVDLKIQVTQHLDIPHESPQVLAFKSGICVDHTSHMKIKTDRLEAVYQ